MSTFTWLLLSTCLASALGRDFLAIGGLDCQPVEAAEGNVCVHLSSVELVSEDEDAGCAGIPPYPLRVSAGTSAFLNGKVVHCGGITDQGKEVSDCFELPSLEEGWKPMAPMPSPDWHMKSAQIILID